MRIFDRLIPQLGLNKLGFYDDILLGWKTALQKPSGLLLVTGPTDSGKTTTMCCSLCTLNTGERNLMAVEDPVEYSMAGVNQVEVNEAAGLSYAAALRSFVAQRPDVIMVGEIRDGETARLAAEAAVDGRLVLATLPTADACGAVPRLLAMGVEPFLVASALQGVLAQRLARSICPKCKEGYPAPADATAQLGGDYPDASFYRGAGCDFCKGSGYRGRSGVHEFLAVNDRIRDLVLARASVAELRSEAVESCGMKTLQYDALRKALDGVTSEQEYRRLTS